MRHRTRGMFGMWTGRTILDQKRPLQKGFGPEPLTRAGSTTASRPLHCAPECGLVRSRSSSCTSSPPPPTCPPSQHPVQADRAWGGKRSHPMFYIYIVVLVAELPAPSRPGWHRTKTADLYTYIGQRPSATFPGSPEKLWYIYI